MRTSYTSLTIPDLYLSKEDMSLLVDVGLRGMDVLANNEKAQDTVQQLALAIIGCVEWEPSISTKKTPAVCLSVKTLFEVVG